MQLENGLEREWTRYFSERNGLHWTNRRHRRGEPFNWELYHEGKLVAGVKTKGVVNVRFQAQYDDMKVRIFVRSSLSGLTEVADSNSKLVATIPSITSSPPLELKMGDGSTLWIEHSGRYELLFVDNIGRRLALSRFDYDSSPVNASFRKMDWRHDDANPWLLAIIGLFIGIHTSGAYP